MAFPKASSGGDPLTGAPTPITADKRKQARKQLPVQPRTALLYAAIESSAPRASQAGIGEQLRNDVVDGAFDALAMPRS